MKKLVSIVACVAIALDVTAAFAQTAAPRTQEFTFTDQLVTSQLPRPDDATVHGRPRHVGGSLIRLRPHFVPELMHSAENL